jgi:hypothetical protein
VTAHGESSAVSFWQSGNAISLQLTERLCVFLLWQFAELLRVPRDVCE